MRFGVNINIPTYTFLQLYIACGQLNIINGGNGVPGPLVSIPGVYTGYEPGILISEFRMHIWSQEHF